MYSKYLLSELTIVPKNSGNNLTTKRLIKKKDLFDAVFIEILKH